MTQDIGVVVVVGEPDRDAGSDVLRGLVGRGFIVMAVRDAEVAAHAASIANPSAVIAFADPLGDCIPDQCEDFHLGHTTPVFVVACPETDAGPWTAVGVELFRAPFDIATVAERLAALSVAQPPPPARPEAAIRGPNGLLVDPSGRRAFVGNRELAVTRLEFDLLEHLLTRRGEVVSADELARHVWGYQGGGSRNYIETRVSRLRGKLRAAGLTHVVENLRAVGYVIR